MTPILSHISLKRKCSLEEKLWGKKQRGLDGTDYKNSMIEDDDELYAQDLILDKLEKLAY